MTDTLNDRVAAEVRAILARRRMSGRQLAAELGVSRSWVSGRLNGARSISLNDLARIAAALNVDPMALLWP